MKPLPKNKLCGRGSLPFPEILKALKKIGYDQGHRCFDDRSLYLSALKADGVSGGVPGLSESVPSGTEIK